MEKVIKCKHNTGLFIYRLKKACLNWKFELSKALMYKTCKMQCNTNYNILTQRYTEAILMIRGDRDKMSYRVR